MRRRSAPTPSLSRYWNGYVGHCAGSVARFRRITYALPAGPARTWLGEIAQRLDVELDAVRRLAIVGDSIEPAWFRVREEPAKRIAQRLEAARSAGAGDLGHYVGFARLPKRELLGLVAETAFQGAKPFGLDIGVLH